MNVEMKDFYRVKDAKVLLVSSISLIPGTIVLPRKQNDKDNCMLCFRVTEHELKTIESSNRVSHKR